jgi:D-lactate dehydrogenase
MGPQRGDVGAEALPVVAQRLFEKAGFEVLYPPRLAELCCGQPFESKGLAQAADAKAGQLEAALAEASEVGRWPIVFDTSPCTYRMQRHLAGHPGTALKLQDSIQFMQASVLPRVQLKPQPGPVAIHPVCSVQKMGLAGTMAALASACSAEVVSVDAVSCCGFAGDRGFTHPELNAHALRRLKAALPAACTVGYSSSRTCEIGLSEHAGRPYRSIIALVEACAQPLESAA